MEPEELGEMFGALARPAAALRLEAPVDAHFDVLFKCSAPGTHRSEFCG